MIRHTRKKLLISCMKKIIHLILLSILPLLINAQTTSYLIKGTVINDKTAKFAYLVVAKNKEMFKVVPIKNNSFSFSGKTDLKGENLKPAVLFVDERGNITMDELYSKLKQGVWINGRKNLRPVILEEVTFEIENSQLASKSKVTSGGILTKQWDESKPAVAQGKSVEFIKKYPDSPVSLSMIDKMVQMNDAPSRGDMDKKQPLKVLYSLLSERLKKSPNGIELKKSIDAL